MFEPIYRLEASRNLEMGSTCLGLSIACNIAQLHSGTLELHKTEGLPDYLPRHWAEPGNPLNLGMGRRAKNE